MRLKQLREEVHTLYANIARFGNFSIKFSNSNKGGNKPQPWSLKNFLSGQSSGYKFMQKTKFTCNQPCKQSFEKLYKP